MSPSRIVRLGTARPAPGKLDVSSLRLHTDRGARVRIGHAIVSPSPTLEESIEGASTLTITVRDRDHVLLRSKFVRKRSKLTLDGISYTLVKTTRAADGALTLLFEETAWNILRDHDSPRKWNRANTTRAQAVKAMIREPTRYRIPCRIPELDVRQPVAAAKRD